MNTISAYYPISIEKIKERVVRKTSNLKRKLKLVESSSIEDCSNVKVQLNSFGEEITRVDGEIPINLSVVDGQRFLFISYEQSILTHGLHKYPAKFFPELPRWLIKRYSKMFDVIIDPFAGSGTSNIEALLNKRHSVGIDIDPFARFLAKVKTTPLAIDLLEISKKEVLNKLLKFKPCLVNKKDIPDFPYRDNWFEKEIILELAYIKKIINQLDYNQEIQDFYKICFSSIIRAVSNADDNCTRTVIRKKLNKKVFPAEALTKFAEALLLNITKMIDFSKKIKNDIKVELPIDSDAINIKYPNNYFDLAITSPPYANAVDYLRTHQLEVYWLGFASGSLTPLKRKYVGTENVKVDDYKMFHKIGIKEADNVIKNIYKKDLRRAYIAYKYLEDMNNNLKEVYRILKPKGKYIIVVGNNKIRGELFENWLYIMKMAEKNGFKLENYFASEIIKHSTKIPREKRINTDWILILEK